MAFREDNQHVVNDLKLETQGHLRTIGANEASISTFDGKFTSLEDREELRNCKSEIETLQLDIKARDKTIIDEAKKASEAKDALKKQLEEAARIPL